MEQLRREYASETKVLLNQLHKAQERDIKTLKNLKNLNISRDMLEKKTSDIQYRITQRESRMSNLDLEETSARSGEIDSTIRDKYNDQERVVKQKNVHAEQKRRDKKEECQEKRKKMYDSFSQQRSNEPSDREFRYHYKRYRHIDETIPNYMRRNLNDMPNNKGYIWKGCWFFGNNPPERGQPQLMFEKLRGGILRIHEYDGYEHKIYEKKGKERKKLVSKKIKKQR